MRTTRIGRFYIAFGDVFSSRSLSSSAAKVRRDKPLTHYELFPSTLQEGPPPKGAFNINVSKLRREFLQLQAKAHPDLHHGQDKARAEGLSALINEAYKTLQNPLLRAQYLLSLRGIEVAEDETAKVEDPELLMEVLETRETIEEAQSEQELEPLKKWNNSRIEDSISGLSKAFAADDLEAAKDEAIRLRYWINIKDSLDAWEKGKPVVLVH
jgi:molecular chaperone HscB